MGGLYQDDYVDRLRHGVNGLCDGWGLSPGARATLLTVSENATFLVADPLAGRRVVARVHRRGYHTREEIASELEWIDALRAADVVVTPEPLARVDGERIASFEDAGERRDVVAFAFLEGEEPAPDERLAEGFRTLGAISARLHAHARSWKRPEGFVRKIWNLETILGESPHWGRWQDSSGLDSADHALLERAAGELSGQLERYGDDASRFGLVHADLRLANLLVDGTRLGVIDFDDCGFSWFMFDFAAAVSFIEEAPLVPGLLAVWCEGYRSAGTLKEEDEAAIPLFVMLRRLQLTAWLASRAETPTAAEFGAGYPSGTVRLARRFLDTGSPLAS